MVGSRKGERVQGGQVLIKKETEGPDAFRLFLFSRVKYEPNNSRHKENQRDGSQDLWQILHKSLRKEWD
jgi:hypothetical protein